MKNGYGKEVCQVLLFLVDQLFTSKNYQFKTPVFPQSQIEEKVSKNDLKDEVEEEEGLSDKDDEDDELYNLANAPSNYQDKNVVETNVDEKEWYQECMRVEKRLIVNKSSERNEWRIHLDMITSNFKKI